MDKVKTILKYIWRFINSFVFDLFGALLLIYFTGVFGISLGDSLHSPSALFGILIFIGFDILHHALNRFFSWLREKKAQKKKK